VAEDTARAFLDELGALPPPVRMGQVFALAKAHMNMPLEEIERLLESSDHLAKVGAVSVMDFQARSRKTSAEQRRELFELYLRRHDRIDTWDLVDRSAIWVVGEHLRDKPRDVLYELAGSSRPMERRTAILSTFAFIRRGELDDAYRIAELLLDDDEDLVHKAVGWMLREAGKKDEARLGAFLDAHAASMPRVMLRYAVEKLSPELAARYRAMKAVSAGRRPRPSGRSPRRRGPAPG
jgi:3-methyladenine DNA glycosylase AlkD